MHERPISIFVRPVLEFMRDQCISICDDTFMCKIILKTYLRDKLIIG